MLAIEQFERAARRFPDRAVVVAPPFSMTYREMSALVDKIANALVTSGLEPGAKISILSQITRWFWRANMPFSKPDASGFQATFATFPRTPPANSRPWT